MPLFICEKCKCIENTATGHYWRRGMTKWKDSSLDGLALCSECEPTEYADGSLNGEGGKWHGRFEKKIIDDPQYFINHPDQHVHFIFLGPYEYLREMGRVKKYGDDKRPSAHETREHITRSTPKKKKEKLELHPEEMYRFCALDKRERRKYIKQLRKLEGKRS